MADVPASLISPEYTQNLWKKHELNLGMPMEGQGLSKKINLVSTGSFGFPFSHKRDSTSTVTWKIFNGCLKSTDWATVNAINYPGFTSWHSDHYSVPFVNLTLLVFPTCGSYKGLPQPASFKTSTYIKWSPKTEWWDTIPLLSPTGLSEGWWQDGKLESLSLENLTFVSWLRKFPRPS